METEKEQGKIDMRHCHVLHCVNRLRNALKEHKKKRGKEHVCNSVCTRGMQKLHESYHEYFNQKEHE